MKFCPKMRKGTPGAVLQVRTVPSAELDANLLAFGVMATDNTAAVCPENERRSRSANDGCLEAQHRSAFPILAGAILLWLCRYPPKGIGNVFQLCPESKCVKLLKRTSKSEYEVKIQSSHVVKSPKLP